MKILTICGSPRAKGNTFSILHAIKENYLDIDFIYRKDRIHENEILKNT